MQSSAQLLNEKLKRRHFFDECILWDFHSTRFGYGLDLSINYIWSKDGCIRNDALEKPLLYVFQLLAVESIRLVGGLTTGMLADLGTIDWGFAEVARVEAFDSPAGCGLSVRWEGTRRPPAGSRTTAGLRFSLIPLCSR
jgi:hypothetical protein